MSSRQPKSIFISLLVYASRGNPFSRQGQDGLVAKFSQHEDSVYSVAWSSVDPWTFASLSYDGRVVVSTVPPDEKRKLVL